MLLMNEPLSLAQCEGPYSHLSESWTKYRAEKCVLGVENGHQWPCSLLIFPVSRIVIHAHQATEILGLHSLQLSLQIPVVVTIIRLDSTLGFPLILLEEGAKIVANPLPFSAGH
jgi:hypothetical protein